VGKYLDAEIAFPGDGDFGGPELIKHTIEMASLKK
jgi:hypothetical protein